MLRRAQRPNAADRQHGVDRILAEWDQPDGAERIRLGAPLPFQQHASQVLLQLSLPLGPRVAGRNDHRRVELGPHLQPRGDGIAHGVV